MLALVNRWTGVGAIGRVLAIGEPVEFRRLDEHGVDLGVGKDDFRDGPLEVDRFDEDVRHGRAVEDLPVGLKVDRAEVVGARNGQLTDVGIVERVIVENEILHVETHRTRLDVGEGKPMHGEIIVGRLECQSIVRHNRPTMIGRYLGELSASQACLVQR